MTRRDFPRHRHNTNANHVVCDNGSRRLADGLFLDVAVEIQSRGGGRGLCVAGQARTGRHSPLQPHSRSARPPPHAHHTVARACHPEMTSLEELAALDVDSLSQSLPEAVQSSASLPALREAVLQLDLQLWLKKEGMEELFPQLMQAEYTSRDSLMVLNPSSLEKVAK